MDLGEAVAFEGMRDEGYVGRVAGGEGVETEEREEQVLVGVGGVGVGG